MNGPRKHWGLKITIVIIGFISLITTILFGGFVIYAIIEEASFDQLVLDFKNGEVSNDKKFTGEYGKLETLVKEDYSFIKEKKEAIENIYQTSVFRHVLSIENYEEDGPDFTKTKAILQDIVLEKDAILEEVRDWTSEAEIEKRMDNIKLESYMRDTYFDYDIPDFIHSIFDETKQFDKMIDAVYDVLEFLSTYKASWYIEDHTLYFRQKILESRYLKLLTNVCPECFQDDANIF